MDKNQIENYINQLKNYEEILSEGEKIDTDFLNKLDDVIKKISTDISKPQPTSIPKQYSAQLTFQSLTIKVKKLHENAVIPSYAKPGDAGMDLTITSILSETKTHVTYGFGVAMEIPFGYVGLVFPRSSIRNYDLALTNCVGVIDSGYRGEIQGTFKKNNWLKQDASEKYNVGDRGAQIIILPYPQVFMVESDELSDTERGTGGFGSTGL
jgi:dUTP pyrophosphatase